MTSQDHDDIALRASAARGDQALRIAAALRDDIISGALPENTELRQEHLARRFGVSRMPVRAALRRLEAEGLILFRPNRSALVVPLSVADLREIYEMRIAAETLALRLALPQLTNVQLTEALDIQRRLEVVDVANFGALNNAFHMTLYRPSSRPRLLAHIETLGTAADRYLRITVASLDYAAKSHSEHHELLEACGRRDETAALACLARHIETAGAALLARMRPPDAPVPED
jgi:DNA-binding GntR family transcriptional regulator